MLKSKYWLIYAPWRIVPYFIISVLLAGIFYVDPPYIISNNFLSQLGQIYINGKLNLIAFLLFNIGLINVGVVIALFYYNLFDFFNDEKINTFLIRALQILGVLSGICFAGIGIFPTDISFAYHVFFANYAFYILLAVSIIQTYLIIQTKKLPNQYAILYVIFCVLLGLYVRLLLFGGNPSQGMPDGMYQAKHVVSQKLIVLTIMIATLHQTIGIKSFYDNLNKKQQNV